MRHFLELLRNAFIWVTAAFFGGMIAYSISTLAWLALMLMLTAGYFQSAFQLIDRQQDEEC